MICTCGASLSKGRYCKRVVPLEGGKCWSHSKEGLADAASRKSHYHQTSPAITNPGVFLLREELLRKKEALERDIAILGRCMQLVDEHVKEKL